MSRKEVLEQVHNSSIAEDGLGVGSMITKMKKYGRLIAVPLILHKGLYAANICLIEHTDLAGWYKVRLLSLEEFDMLLRTERIKESYTNAHLLTEVALLKGYYKVFQAVRLEASH